MNVIYAPNGTTGNGVGNFNFLINDWTGDSPEGTITVNVSPPGVPNVLFFAKSTSVEIQFDRTMADPTGKEDQFTIVSQRTNVPNNYLCQSEKGDPYTIVLTLTPALPCRTCSDILHSRGPLPDQQEGSSCHLQMNLLP